MDRRFSSQQLQVLFFVPVLLTFLLATTGRTAAGNTYTTDVDTPPSTDTTDTPPRTDTTDIDIKDTDYPIPSDAYFVSPNGLNTNSGKYPDSPWPVAKALAQAPSGATIVFRGGTYRNINGASIRKQLTLQPYPHEKAWLKGSVVVTGWVADGARWRKNGWTYSFPSNVGRKAINPEYLMAGYRDMVYINGVSLKQVASKAKVVPGTFYVDSANDQLYIGDNPKGKTVEATALKEGFVMWKSNRTNPSETVVRGLGFAHYADRAISVAAPSVTLENNTFVWNGVQGATFWGESNKTLGVSSDGIVRGNTFSHNGRSGLGGDRAHNILVEHNTISYNNVERFATSWDGSGIKFLRTDGLIWRKNLVEHNFANGMWVDISSTNAKIVNNISRYNLGTGIFWEISHKAIIASNLAYNNGYTGIMLSNSSGARVYNNTLANNGKNLQIKETSRQNTNAAEIAKGIAWTTRDNVVKNNIFSNSTGNALFESPNCDSHEKSKPMVAAADYNAYYRRSSSRPRSIIKWWMGTKKCAVDYASIDAFNSKTSFEEHALVVDDVATNPFFVDEAHGDYRLKPGSPAIGRGAPLPADIAKAIGVVPGMPVDLGALQSNVFLLLHTSD